MNAPRNIQDGLISTVAELGTMRDKAATVSYIETEYQDHELVAAYRTSWLAKKIVDIPAQDMFRAWRSWQAEEDQIEKLEKTEKTLGLQGKLLRAKKLARLYGECHLYFDMGEDPSLPVNPERVRKGGLRFVTILTHRQLQAGEMDQDPLSPSFGRPLWYAVVGSTQGNVRIHPSRLITLTGVARPDVEEFGRFTGGRLGDSSLTALMEAVKQFDGVSANINSLVYEAKIDVISVAGLTTHIAGNPHEEQKLLSRYRLAATAKGNNGMLILDKDNETYDQKSYSFAALADIMDRYAQNSAGGADIPMTRLFGRSPGGMNATGDSDLRNYYDRISSDQELEARPALEVFDECLIRSALGTRPPETYYKWSSLWQVSDKERAELGRIGVQTIKTLKDTALIPDEVLSRVAVNLLTQDGVIPGLEAEYAQYFAEGGEDPWDQDGEDPPDPPEGTRVQDEQPRAPKGSPNGGPATLYVSRKVLNAQAIWNWAQSQGYKDLLPPNDLHVTICYSTKPVDWMAMGQPWEETIEIPAGGPRMVETFGEGAQVLLFASSSLKWRHDEFVREGASWDHAEYQPHITLTYTKRESETAVQPYTGKIVFGPEIFEEIKTDAI